MEKSDRLEKGELCLPFPWNAVAPDIAVWLCTCSTGQPTSIFVLRDNVETAN